MIGTIIRAKRRALGLTQTQLAKAVAASTRCEPGGETRQSATEGGSMKTVTVEQFKGFSPCWLGDAEGRRRLESLAKIRNEWTALDVLALDSVSAKDKLWAVLREEFIPAETLHEFACWCAEQALALVDSPDPRSVAAIAAKRAWLRGEINGEQLDAALAAAWDAALAAARAAERAAARAAAWDAAWAAQITQLRSMLEVQSGN